MINVSSEALLSLSEAAGRLPKRRRGKRPHIATLYRWAQRGVRGIRLETIQVGGTLCTSLEALQRFFDRLSQPDAPIQTTPSAEQARAQAEAEAVCARAGI